MRGGGAIDGERHQLATLDPHQRRAGDDLHAAMSLKLQSLADGGVAIEVKNDVETRELFQDQC